MSRFFVTKSDFDLDPTQPIEHFRIKYSFRRNKFRKNFDKFESFCENGLFETSMVVHYNQYNHFNHFNYSNHSNFKKKIAS